MKALVTGGTGFIGTQLVHALLARGDSVRVLARSAARAAPLQTAGVQVVIGDLREPASFAGITDGIDVVFHLGSAINSPGADFEQVDVHGTQRLLEQAQRSGVRRLVFAGTLAGYPLPRLRDGAVIDENCGLDQSGLLGSYARSKARAEAAILEAHRRGSLEGVILRLGLTCGVGAPLFPPHVCRVVGGLMLVFGDGSLPLPLLLVDNAVDAFMLAATLPQIGGEVFNILDQEVLTQLQYLRLYGEATGTTPRIVRLPRLAYYTLGAVTELVASVRHKEPTTTRYRVRARLRRVRWDCSKAHRVLKWQSRIPLRTGLTNVFRASVGGPQASQPSCEEVAGNPS